jgi:hypothetical protein
MDNRAIWAGRVEEWKASGLPSKAFCQGKPFTAGGLRYWAYRLRQDGQRKVASAPIRIARVVARPAAVPIVPAVITPPALVVECGALRVAVRPGFDRETLGAVLDVLASRGGAR